MSQRHTDRPAFPRHLEPTPPGSARKPTPQRRPLPPYKVILHYSSRDLMFIVRTVMELTRLCRAEATHKMWEVHHYGRSKLLVTYKERAELYVDQFADRGLTASVEPA